jgi:hypothetical protein
MTNLLILLAWMSQVNYCPSLRSASNVHCVLCPECKKCDVDFDVAFGACVECSQTYDLNFLIEAFEEDEAIAYCPECSYTHEYSVIAHGCDFLCLGCATSFSEVGTCDWCHEVVAGDLEGSYSSGCMLCDGHIGYHRND